MPEMQCSRLAALPFSSILSSGVKVVGSAVHTPRSICFAASLASFLRYFIRPPERITAGGLRRAASIAEGRLAALIEAPSGNQRGHHLDGAMTAAGAGCYSRRRSGRKNETRKDHRLDQEIRRDARDHGGNGPCKVGRRKSEGGRRK